MLTELLMRIANESRFQFETISDGILTEEFEIQVKCLDRYVTWVNN